MSVYVPKIIRKFVIDRAANRCEYCRIPQSISIAGFHIEHIIGLQHGGTNFTDNLAWCCAFCNWKKGPNIATMLDPTGPILPLFNPRTQHWFDHFKAENGYIDSLTETGQGTARLLEFNIPERVEIRAALTTAGFYP